MCIVVIILVLISLRVSKLLSKQAMSRSYHQGKSCGPCYLCGKVENRYDHFSGLPVEVQTLIQSTQTGTIPGNSCLCRIHQKEVQRNLGNPKYVPTWNKENQTTPPKSTQHCVYSDCVASSNNTRIIAPCEDTEEAFRQVLNGTEQPIFLCQTHYQCLYRKIHAHIPCAGCDAKPKSSQGGYTRHSPDALSVTNYLNEHTEFEVTITPTDVLCKSCYDMHLVIIKNMESLDNIPDLSSDMSLWSMIVCEEHTTELTRAVLNTVIHVAKMLQQERALLLPQVVNVFTQNYSSSDNTNLELDNGTIKFSARWLMSQLITYLQPYMEYKCVVKRLGTVLYPRNGNLVKTLSLALYQSTPQCINMPQSSSHKLPTTRSVVQEAGYVINGKIHEQIKKNEDLTDLTSFSLEDSINNIDPLLWEFVCLCTRSVRESTGRTHGDDYEYIKNVRRYFIICMIMFTTNPLCDTALHNLVADTVEVYGGSRQLIRVLNRLGVCVSCDTHDRLVTCVAEQQSKASLWSELTPHTFTVASVDNIDFLQSHAAVYSGDQSRSYHGTTIQAVQPIPSLKAHSSSTTVTDQQLNATPDTCSSMASSSTATLATTLQTSYSSQPAPEGSGKRHISSSPASSPHKHGKIGPKKRRTMQVVANTKLFASNAADNTHTLNPLVSIPPLLLEQFKETECEIASKNLLSNQVFTYFIQKFVQQNSTLDGVLKPLRQFLLPTPAQLANHERSAIYYMQLLDENADSEETLAEVAVNSQ